jgi:hypothetical protein
MRITQLAVFIEDKPGRVAHVAAELAAANVNILGFDLADTAEGYGVLRLITNDPDRALETLSNHNYSVTTMMVICAKVPTETGGLARTLGWLAEHQVGIEYLYVILNSWVILGVRDVDAAIQDLMKRGVELVTNDDLRSL